MNDSSKTPAGLVVVWVAWIGAGCATTLESSAVKEHTYYCAVYVQEGSLDQAEARCELALELSGNRAAEAWNLMGIIARARGDLPTAVESFKRAIASKRDFPEALNNYGETFMERRDYQQACDLFAQAAQLSPEYVVARGNLGKCLYHLGRRTDARKEYFKCTELDPAVCDCRLGLGVIAVDERRLEEAERHFTMLVQGCPADAVSHYNLCWLQLEQGRCAEALPHCQEAVAIDSAHEDAQRALAGAAACAQ